jgi:predicted nucleic acid-binding protein
LDAGERGAIAVALNRSCALAIDDWSAIRRALQAAALGENMLSILRTQDIVVE